MPKGGDSVENLKKVHLPSTVPFRLSSPHYPLAHADKQNKVKTGFQLKKEKF